MTASRSTAPITDDAFDGCVAAVYQASTGLIGWNDACLIIADAFALRMVHIIGVDKQDGRLVFSWQSPGRTQRTWEIDYYADYHAKNPRLGPAMALQGDEWFHDHEVFDDDFVASNVFFQEFALPHGVRNLSGTKILDDDRHVVLLGVMRATEAPRLGSAEMTALARLRKHLVAAMEVYTAMRDQADRIYAGDAILASLPMPVVMLDDTRRVRYRNEAAGRLMAEGNLLIEGSGTVRLARARDDKALGAQMLQLSLASSTPDGTAQRFALRIGEPNTPTDTVMIGLRIHPEPSMQVFGSEPRVILILHPLRDDGPVDPFIIGHVFGLSPAEADVAAALARGETPEGIGRRRGVSLSTIRSQIRSVYDKLDVSRQAELVWLLARLPAPPPTGGAAPLPG